MFPPRTLAAKPPTLAEIGREALVACLAGPSLLLNDRFSEK